MHFLCVYSGEDVLVEQSEKPKKKHKKLSKNN